MTSVTELTGEALNLEWTRTYRLLAAAQSEVDVLERTLNRLTELMGVDTVEEQQHPTPTREDEREDRR